MTILRARFNRWWHCLTHLHRQGTWRALSGALLQLDCADCGEVFYRRPEQP